MKCLTDLPPGSVFENGGSFQLRHSYLSSENIDILSHTHTIYANF